MTDSVMVFAPGPLLTVTIESHGDGVDLHVHPGGQGVWQARMIALLGAPVVLCTVLGGEISEILGKVLQSENFTVRALDRRSGSGWYVHDRRDGERAQVAANPGPHHLEAVLEGGVERVTLKPLGNIT